MTLPKDSRSCRRAARGSPTTARASVRAATNAKNFLRDNPDIFEEISELVRQNADKLYAKSIKGGSAPKPVEKAEEEGIPEQAENTRKNVQADIDITVDDDE